MYDVLNDSKIEAKPTTKIQAYETDTEYFNASAAISAEWKAAKKYSGMKSSAFEKSDEAKRIAAKRRELDTLNANHRFFAF